MSKEALASSPRLNNDVGETSKFNRFVRQLRQGDSLAAEQLMVRYARRLRSLAARRIGSVLQAKVDPEDALQSALASFFVSLRTGKWDFDSSRGLKSLLGVLVARKCARYHERYAAARRDVTRERALHAIGESWESEVAIASREPIPGERLVRSDWLDYVLRNLDDQDRRVARMVLDGHSTAETALAIQRSQRTIQRTVLRIIREIEPATFASGQSHDER